MSDPLAYPIIGVAGTGTHPRLEIGDLQKNSIQFSLFIRALNNIQDMRSEDPRSPDYKNNPNSWWQIGAIHGLPFEPWSGDPKGPKVKDPDSPFGGYCYHGSVLFLTWHRVLMLLVEQAVVNEAIRIAESFNNEEWIKAARELRFPFWDWTRWRTEKEGIPEIFQVTKIRIAVPGSPNRDSVPNPLNHYLYVKSPGEVSYAPYMAKWKRTYRWVPVKQNNDPKTEEYGKALEAFAEGIKVKIFDEERELQPVERLRQKVAGLFEIPLTLKDPGYGPNLWAYCTNTGARGENNPVDPPPNITIPSSLEEPHNLVHLNTGGNGSMSTPQYAGFDPIFYLHHCNVDRLYAFWEYVYPDYWIGNGWKSKNGIVPFKADQGGNFQYPPFAEINQDTALIPFRTADESKYWTSENARSLWAIPSKTQKHYTYPPIRGSGKNPVEVKVDVPYDTKDTRLRARFRQALFREWKGKEIAETLQLINSLSNNLKSKPYQLVLEWDENNRVSGLRNFVVIGELPEFAFDGSYHLELYLPTEKGEASGVQVVNSISVFARADPKVCAACRDRLEAGSTLLGHMSLDPLLVLHLISKANLKDDGFDLEKLRLLLNLSFGMRLVRPDGQPLAASDPHIVYQDGEVLEKEKTPKLTFHSHVIKFDYNVDKDDTGITLPFLDFDAPVDHGVFGLEGEETKWAVFS